MPPIENYTTKISATMHALISIAERMCYRPRTTGGVQ